MKSVVINDETYFPVPISLTAPDCFFDLKDQMTHVVVFVHGVFLSGSHVHHRPAVFVVTSYINLSRFVFFSENGGEVVLIFIVNVIVIVIVIVVIVVFRFVG